MEMGLKGITPVRYHSAGWYRGELRREILRQRVKQDRSVLQAITFALRKVLPANALLVPIPSWKAEHRANPLPTLICRSLELTTQRLLKRCRRTVGQHHLVRNQRLVNMQSAFEIDPDHQARPVKKAPTWVVDDILTSGATATEALQTLKQHGVEVQGLICLARTP